MCFTASACLRRMVLTAILCVVWHPALADWTLVDSGTEVTAYADKTSIQRTENSVTMWSLVDFSTPQRPSTAPDVPDGSTAVDATYRSMRSQREYDCADEKVRLLWFSTHSGSMGTGAVTYSDSEKGEWKAIPAQSLAQTLFQLACWGH